jgi:hypothetical protein
MPRPLSMAPGELRYFILKYAGEKTLYEMHKETGVNALTIVKYAEELGVAVTMDTDSEKEKIDSIILDNPTLAATEIAKLLNITVGKVVYRARRIGIELRYAPSKRPAKANVKQKEKLFDVEACENWLV